MPSPSAQTTSPPGIPLPSTLLKPNPFCLVIQFSSYSVHILACFTIYVQILGTGTSFAAAH